MHGRDNLESTVKDLNIMAQQKSDTRSVQDTGEGNEAESRNTAQRHKDPSGKHGESGYPNDDYWDDTARDNPGDQPADSPEPANGYRWEPAEDKQGSESEESASKK